MQLDNNKKVKLHVETVYKDDSSHNYNRDTSKMGYFVGIASDTIFNRLVNIIESIGIEKLDFDKNANCCDGSLITIIVYYNGKRKYLQSMFPPDKADTLISTLFKICESSESKPTKERFEIEDEKASR